MNRQRRDTWMMVGSMAIFGTIGAFVRHIPLPSGEIALWRAVLATVPIGLEKRRKLCYTIKNREGSPCFTIPHSLPPSAR